MGVCTFQDERQKAAAYCVSVIENVFNDISGDLYPGM
jgi:hypothetical protein